MPIPRYDYYSPSMKAGLVRTPSRTTPTAAATTATKPTRRGASPPNHWGGGGGGDGEEETEVKVSGSDSFIRTQSGTNTNPPPPPPRSLVVTSPAAKQQSAMESLHQSELLQRQDVHNALLAATEARRDRAQTILALHRGEIEQLEALVRQTESDTVMLEGLRRELSDALRRQEVVAYRTTKDVKLLQQEEQREKAKAQLAAQQRIVGAAMGNAAGLSGPSSLLSAAVSRGLYGTTATTATSSSSFPVTSPLRTLLGSMPPSSAAVTASAASILSAPNAGAAIMLFPHLHHDATTLAGASSYDMFAQRLQEARRIADALEQQCAENDALLSAHKKERAAVKDLIAVAESHIRDLEKDGPATLDALKEAQTRLRTATEHAQLLPDLRRFVEDSAQTLFLQKQSSAAITRALMDVIKADDGKLQLLRRTHGGSGTAASLEPEGQTQQQSMMPATRRLAEEIASIHSPNRLHQQVALGGVLHGGAAAADSSPPSAFAGGNTLAGLAASGSIVGKIAADVEEENQFYAKAIASLLHSGEEQRAQLNATAETLSSRARYLEDRLVRVRSS